MKTMTIKKTRCEFIHLTPKEGKSDEVKKMLGLYETDHNEDGSGNRHLTLQRPVRVDEFYSDKLKELCEDILYEDDEGVLDIYDER